MSRSFGRKVIATPSDPDFSIRLPMNGADNSTSFVDNSRSPQVITVAGDAKMSTVQKKFGSASAYFDGTGDYLKLGHWGNVFTWECWIYLTSLAAVNGILYAGNPGDNVNRILLDVKTTGALTFFIADSTGTVVDISTPTSSIVVDTWHHIAGVRNGSTAWVFADGSGTSGVPARDTPGACWPIYIGTGRNASVQKYCTGYIDMVRFTFGKALYTANFTPPACPFDTPNTFKQILI